MRIFAFSIAALSIVCGADASAKMVLQLDERCVARDTLVCGLNQGAYLQSVFAMRGLHTMVSKDQGLADLATLRQNFLKLSVVANDTSINAFNACEVFVRAAPDLCVVEVDVVTAEELRSAIREGNEAVLKAWLAAIDEQRQQ